MSVFFKTQTGSLYEIDEDGKRVRRLAGSGNPTTRTGTDGEWKRCERMFHCENGRFFFDWDGEGHGTLTSPGKITEAAEA